MRFQLIIISLFQVFFSLSAHAQTVSDIEIIGGGIAGLAGLHYAKLAGLNAHNHEAAPFVGGRIRASYPGELGGPLIETGAMLVDLNHFEMRELSQWYAVPLIPRFITRLLLGQAPQRRYYFFNEMISGPELFRRIMAESPHAIARYMLDEKNMSNLTRDKIPVEEYMTQIQAGPYFRELVTAAIESELGRGIKEVSCLSVFDTLSFDIEKQNIRFLPHNDESLVFDGGTQRLTSRMREKHYKEVFVDSRLIKVEHLSDKNLRLTFQNTKGERKTVVTKKIMLAIPPSEYSKIEWSSESARTAIANIVQPQYAQNAKTLLEFNGRVWGAEPLEPILGRTQSNLSFQLWDGSSTTRPNAASLFLFTGLLDDETRVRGMHEILGILEPIYPHISDSYKTMHFINWDHSYTTAYRVGEWSAFHEKGPPTIEGVLWAGEHWGGGYMNDAVRTARLAVQSGDCSGFLLPRMLSR